MTFNVELKGLPKLNSNIDKYIKREERKISKAIHDAGFFLEGEIKESIAGRRAEQRSVDTGLFMRSMFTDIGEPLRATVGTTLKYPKYLEYGTTKITPRHHFRNSIKRNEHKIVKFVKKKIKR